METVRLFSDFVHTQNVSPKEEQDVGIWINFWNFTFDWLQMWAVVSNFW